jgi:hypothetical protein
MARPKTKVTTKPPITPVVATTTTADDAVVEIHAVIPDNVESAPADDVLVDVRCLDDGDWTTDVYLTEGVAKFVHGVARVTPHLAQALIGNGLAKGAK